MEAIGGIASPGVLVHSNGCKELGKGSQIGNKLLHEQQLQKCVFLNSSKMFDQRYPACDDQQEGRSIQVYVPMEKRQATCQMFPKFDYDGPTSNVSIED